MNKKSFFVVLFAMLCLAVFTVSVSADQDGHTNWCNMDQYGCWVTGDEGEQIYIMFWTEDARKLFMGDSTAPYKDVQDRCLDCEGGRLALTNYWAPNRSNYSFSDWKKQCEARGGEVVLDHIANNTRYYLCKTN